MAAPKVVPRDKDGDGIFDNVDARPTAAGPESPEPRVHGCPDADHRSGDEAPKAGRDRSAS
ncbi:MAG: hypothetical protein HYV09_08370 [Deltaproteobacteria bacterium]|nr:hypothetical protein [Deltaproteobacteria bacterium]